MAGKKKLRIQKAAIKQLTEAQLKGAVGGTTIITKASAGSYTGR